MKPSLKLWAERRGGIPTAANKMSENAHARERALGDSEHSTELGTVIAEHMDAAALHREAGNHPKAAEHVARAKAVDKKYQKLTGNSHPSVRG